MKRCLVMLAAAAALAILALLAGCGAPHTSGAAAEFQLVHLSDDTANVRLYVDSVLVENLAGARTPDLLYPHAGAVLQSDSGTRLMEVRDPSTNADVATESLVLAGGSVYDLLLLGRSAPQSGEPPISLMTVGVATGVPASSAHVRLVHAAIGQGPVDVVFQRTNGTVVPIATGLSYGQVTNTSAGTAGAPGQTQLFLLSPSTGALLVQSSGTTLASLNLPLVGGDSFPCALLGTPGNLSIVTWTGP
jgi:hypothetical protein